MSVVTDLRARRDGEARLQTAAAAAADRAAAEARVTVRELTDLVEVTRAATLFRTIWQPGPHGPPMTAELMRALSKSGNYVAGAYAGRRLVGASVAFFAAPTSRSLHSHIAGVAGPARGGHVGFALKLHQRAWALARGVASIWWTFDPLVRRNAGFNLGKLAAECVEYLPDFYGPMHDGINGGDDTDRLLVHWPLTAARTIAACSGRPGSAGWSVGGHPDAVVALGRSPAQDPLRGPATGDRLVVAIPTDVEGLRRTDPRRAGAWRLAVRDVLGGLLSQGARVAGFDRDGWYVVDRRAGHGSARG